jgi:hypothetical protein
MNRAILSSRLPALALAAGYLAAATPAAAQVAPPTTTGAGTGVEGDQPKASSTTFVDINAGIGYSSNPLLEMGGRSSAFARVSLLAVHSWNSERGSTSVSGFVENTTYVRGGYGSKQIFNLNARTRQAVSEKVSVFGDLGFSGDIAGQLSNRFVTPVPVGTPPPPDTNPPPGTNPELFNFSGRQYRLTGTVGATIATSARSNVSLSAGASHGFFTGSNKIADYSTYQGTFGYNHQLSEPTWVGATVSVTREDFAGSDYANVINTAATIRTQLGQNITANGSVGILAVYDHRAGVSEHSYSPSFSGAICATGERSSLCANVSRDASVPLGFAQSQGARGASISTNLGLNYSRILAPGQTIRAALTATRESTVARVLDTRFTSTYVSGLVGYDRKVGARLFAGVSAGARKLYQNGPDPRMDFNGSVYLRYRLGDLL